MPTGRCRRYGRSGWRSARPPVPLALRQVGPRCRGPPPRALQPARPLRDRRRHVVRRTALPGGHAHRAAPGAAFGPFVVGDAGTLLFEVMMGDPRSWGDDPGAFHRALAAHGAEALPDPAIELPDVARGPSFPLGGRRPRAMTPTTLRRALSKGSISLRLYPHVGLSAPEMVRELRHQAVLATEAGFDGVMTSEHHGGVRRLHAQSPPGGGVAARGDADWVGGTVPVARHTAPARSGGRRSGVAGSARFPGRVGLGLAVALSTPTSPSPASPRTTSRRVLATALAQVAGALGGTDVGLLADDPAVAGWRRPAPVPVVSAAISETSARRGGAPRCRPVVGLAVDAGAGPCPDGRVSRGGGNRPCVLVRRVWMGIPPTADVVQQVDRYRAYASPGAQTHWQGEQMVVADRSALLAEELAGVSGRAGVDGAQPPRPCPGRVPRDGVRPDSRLE